MPDPNPTICYGVRCEDCPQPMPERLTATITNDSSCECADGQTVELAYNATLIAWMGSAEICGVTWPLVLECFSAGTGFQLCVNCGSGQCFSTQPRNCDPLVIMYNFPAMYTQCCEGQAGYTTITITE